MDLKDVVYQMIDQKMKASQLSDLRTGTVTAVNPLEITINTAMAPLRASILLLTSAVIEKKIPVLQHNHTNPEGGNTGNALLQSEIMCYENGQPLPVENGYIILNRALEVGDKVILLRVQKGQKFIVLSRVFEGAS